ncbi:MAG: biliverdin-producing heme oxygenase [Mycobacterium sp.]|nr:biliverdin-producing heme oxygenase [Mycobacterium sp.]
MLAPLAGSATLPEYQRALAAMYAITAPVESCVADYLEARRLPLDYRARRRTPKLLQDLEFYGLMPPGPVWAGPTIPTDGELVGCLYVLEGATRGSRHIFRRMTKTLGISEGRGGQFFSGHGDRSDARWQEFWSFAAEHCPPEKWAEAGHAAVTLLSSYRALLDPFEGR